MSKITNDGLTRSHAGCCIAVPMAIVNVKGLKSHFQLYCSVFMDVDRAIKMCEYRPLADMVVGCGAHDTEIKIK